MNVCIRQFSARCSLGDQLDACVDNLLESVPAPSSLSFAQLGEAISLPYFCAPREDDFYRELEITLDHLLQSASLDRKARQNTALLIGSSSFDVHISEARYRADIAKRGAETAVPMPIIGYGKLAERLAGSLSLGPVRYTYSTACTSSANALLYAGRLIRCGVVEHALVLGTEHRNTTSALGFHGLGLVSPSGEMHPFDANRDGLILGEGLGALLLSPDSLTPPHERRWQLAGGAIGTDNHSLTAAHVSGEEIACVIRAALADAGVAPGDIQAVKVHGTASLKNDEAEASALQAVFSEIPKAFALKPFIGHTLGACGALEAALTLGALARGVLPANPRARSDGQLGVKLHTSAPAAGPGYYLFNCFAFGGNNNALVLRDLGAGE